MFGVLFPNRSFPLDITTFVQVDDHRWLLDMNYFVGKLYWSTRGRVGTQRALVSSHCLVREYWKCKNGFGGAIIQMSKAFSDLELASSDQFLSIFACRGGF